MTVAKGLTWPAAETRRPAPLPAWCAPAGFAALVVLLILAGQGGVLRLGFPAGAFLVAAWLFIRDPAVYLGFAWWIWFLSPGIRRIVDSQMGGWDPANPMSLTPFLVSSLALVGVARRIPELRRKRLAPWGLALACVLYGYFTGVLRVGPVPATHALISWLMPLGFGLFCAVEWRRYPDFQATVRRVFVWGVLLLAGYGILQFLSPPIWDQIWMTSSGMYSLGRAFPYELRVFSLVNAPLAFATILMAGLLVALSVKAPWRFVLLASESAALLLSLVRSVWLAGFFGMLVYLASVPLRSSRRIIAAGLLTAGVLLAVVMALPAEVGGPTMETVRDRLLTFTNISRDVSFQDRSSFLDNISTVVAQNPLGHGLGSTGVSSQLGASGGGIRDFDNGIFAALYTLGWAGGIGMLIAALCVTGFSLQRREASTDLMAKAAKAMVITSLLLLAGSNTFEGVSAALFWGFAGLVAASHQWHDARRREALP
jgi:hypothetical protein